MVDKDGSAPLCRLAPRCSPLREAIVDLRAPAVRAAAGRQARCGGPRGAKLAPAAHIFDVCVVYTVCTPAPVPSVPTREALMPVFAPCPDWLGGGSRLACNRSRMLRRHESRLQTRAAPREKLSWARRAGAPARIHVRLHGTAIEVSDMQAHLLHPLHARESLLHGQVEPGSERRAC